MDPKDFWFSVGLPFGVAFISLALFGGRRWGVALSLGAAYAVGHVVLLGDPEFPPTQVEDWSVPLALAAALVGACISHPRAGDSLAWVGRLLLTFGILNAVLTPLISQWDALRVFYSVQAILALILIVWASLDELAERVTGVTVPLTLTLTAAAAAYLPVLGGAHPLGQRLGVLMLVMLAAAAMALFRRSMSLARGGVAVYVTVLSSLLLCCVFYGDDVPMVAALTIALTPLLAWVRASPTLSSMRPWLATGLTLILVLIPLVIALWPEVARFIQTMTPTP